MKLLQPLAGVVLAGSVAAGLWLWLHGAPPLPNPVPVAAQPEPAPEARPKPAPVAKMAVIKRKRANTQPSASNPAPTGWSAVHLIINKKAGYEQRLQAIHALPSHLTEEDWALLQKFLLRPNAQDKGQLGQVIKNQLLDVLCAFNLPPTGLGDVLAKMYENQKQNEVIRDYAVQHMGAYYEQISGQPKSAQAEQAVQGVLWKAVNERNDSIGGTALLALKRLSQEYPGFNQAQIANTAVQMAGDPIAGELTHITAYQVCAQLGATDALPMVRQAAQNGETISVQMSALGALGQLGGTEDISLLKSVLEGTQERLKPAAQHALEQITARQNQLAGQK
jgi:hypothetical protein